MKPYYIFAFLILLMVVSEARSFNPPEIKGVKGSVTGETNISQVKCTLKLNARGLHKEGEYVTGVLHVDSDYVTLGVSLTIYSAKGFKLLSSASLQGEIKGTITEYTFAINKELLESSNLTIFTSNGMYRLDLNSVTMFPPEKQ
ncbi:hypothetical protein HW115_19135 [Verrucomicrobiaceae bacterium N1E253]|uniref:Uncharacterized protein n=1 Tax=Oceaniferula marina TaxID=2748318 RepID=A0A851GPC1_9BACT|nr:hypothetical protein [Oceaniferula marina]NWK57741.1 hypothetical protein [Oceaniferula marina]